MKTLLSPILAISCAFVTTAACADLTLHSKEVVAGSEEIHARYETWREDKPRKLAIQFVEVDQLPKKIRALGYNNAVVETGMVILISSLEDDPVIEGVAVILDGRNRDKILKEFGWQLSDTDDPRLRLIQRKK